jgi:hypothetical protein
MYSPPRWGINNTQQITTNQSPKHAPTLCDTKKGIWSHRASRIDTLTTLHQGAFCHARRRPWRPRLLRRALPYATSSPSLIPAYFPPPGEMISRMGNTQGWPASWRCAFHCQKARVNNVATANASVCVCVCVCACVRVCVCLFARTCYWLSRDNTA